MRISCLIFFLLFPLIATAQCKGIKTRTNRHGATVWNSSYSLPVGVERVVDATTDSLFVTCNVGGSVPGGWPTGVTFTFSDGTSYRDSTQRARMMYVGDKFHYIGFISMANDSLKNIFLSKEITAFRLGAYGGPVKKVQADALRRYLDCMLKQQ